VESLTNYTTSLVNLAEMFPVPEKPDDEDPKPIQEELGELVQRALVQAADMQDAEEKLKRISRKTSRITPPPKPAE